MRSLQTIRKNKVTNYYTFGKRLQKWCCTNINLMLDTAGCGFSDGGCRVLAEALVLWSHNYLITQSYASRKGVIEHIVATFKDTSLNTYVLDSDGMGSVSDGCNKLYVLEKSACSTALKKSVGTISNYKTEFPELIYQIADKLEQDLGKFKTNMLVAGSKIELPTHNIIDNVVIQNLEYSLRQFENYHTIPKLNNARQAIDLFMVPLKDKSKDQLDYFTALKYVSIRDKWTISDDDYIYAIKNYFVRHDLQDWIALGILLPTWGPKVDKFFMNTIKNDLWKLGALDQITLCYQIENRLGNSNAPCIDITRDADFTTFKYKDERLLKTNTKFMKIAYIQEIFESDPEQFKKLLEDENGQSKSILINLLVRMLKMENTTKLQTIIKEHLQVDQFMFTDLYDLLTLVDIKNTDTKMKDLILRGLYTIKVIDKHKILFDSDLIPVEWINEYMSKTLQINWFENLYKYPSILSKLSATTRLKMVENLVLSDNIHFYTFDADIEDVIDSTEDCVLKLVKIYIGDQPQITNMINMAKTLDPTNALKRFKELYNSTLINIDSEVSLPEMF